MPVNRLNRIVLWECAFAILVESFGLKILICINRRALTVKTAVTSTLWRNGIMNTWLMVIARGTRLCIENVHFVVRYNAKIIRTISKGFECLFLCGKMLSIMLIYSIIEFLHCEMSRTILKACHGVISGREIIVAIIVHLQTNLILSKTTM